MNEPEKTPAKVLLVIPPIISFLVLLCFLLAALLEMPTDRGTLYLFFALPAIFGFFFMPVPCLILSVLGTVLAARAKRKRLVAAGITETLFGAVILIFAVLAFLQGLSV